MLTYDEMLDDNDDLRLVEVDFPRLEDDSAASCPIPMKEILEYLSVESGDVALKELSFIRTARVAEWQYWIWRFDDGGECYVTAAIDADGNAEIGYDQNWHGLSPEQFILGTYHQVF